MKGVKPLFIQMPFESDIGNIVQIARAEAKKVFRCSKVKIYDIIRWYPHGWIAMCQNGDLVVQSSDGCIAEDLKTE